MSPLDWILLVIRWAHGLAAMAWVGGGIFYLMVWRPIAARSPALREMAQDLGPEFRGLVNTAIMVLLLTGVILSVARLTEDAASVPYVAVLAVKILLAAYMFYVVRFLRRRSYPEEQAVGTGRWEKLRTAATGTTAVLVTGVVVFGLSDVLTFLFEDGLRG